MKRVAWVVLLLLAVFGATALLRQGQADVSTSSPVSAHQQPPAPLAGAPAPRHGIVKLEGRAFADDGGKYLAVGTTLFPEPWLFRNERPRLEQNLRCLAGRSPERTGCPKSRVVDYVRVLGAVVGNGGECAPNTNPWGCRATTVEDLLTSDLIAEVTDLNYDAYRTAHRMDDLRRTDRLGSGSRGSGPPVRGTTRNACTQGAAFRDRERAIGFQQSRGRR